MRHRFGALLALITLIAACGADPDSDSSPLDGIWSLTELTVEEGPVDGAALVIELDTVDAILRGRTVCHQIFGSFTLLDDGTASFTVPGRSSESCADADQLTEDLTLDGLERVSSWQVAGGQLLLADPDGARLVFDPAG